LESYVFLGALLSFALIETFRPFRAQEISAPRRWFNHAVLLAINTVANIVLFRGGAVVFAIFISDKAYGLLHRFAPFYALRFAVGFLAIDLVHYASHRLYHRIPLLWRIHSVHHTDPGFDVTTGFRFHPFESLLTQGADFALIALLGPPPLAVLAAEAVTLFQDIFEHANVEVPRALDRMLTPFLIGPSLHRVHHSVAAADYNRNFGTIFPWWDRLFGTYAARSSVELRRMDTGLSGYSEDRSTSVVHTLRAPFD